MSEGEAIAVNNEGDVFVNGYGSGSFVGVIEYPADDLIVVDNPDFCAGGYEGIMLIYPRPYRASNFTGQNLNAEYCAGKFRLDARSKHIYFGDATFSGFPFIDSRTYPDAQGGGPYSGGYSLYLGGFTTIPNTLPN
jgi:hypothetical protein